MGGVSRCWRARYFGQTVFLFCVDFQVVYFCVLEVQISQQYGLGASSTFDSSESTAETPTSTTYRRQSKGSRQPVTGSAALYSLTAQEEV